jgi:hypothetical protein
MKLFYLFGGCLILSIGLVRLLFLLAFHYIAEVYIKSTNLPCVLS